MTKRMLQGTNLSSHGVSERRLDSILRMQSDKPSIPSLGGADIHSLHCGMSGDTMEEKERQPKQTKGLGTF